MEKEIEVVGAGPAGLIAAITLSMAGYSVTVCEEKSNVGQRFHEDFQGIENWSSVEDVTLVMEKLGIYGKLKREILFQPYNEFTIFDADLNRKVARSERPFFYLVKKR